MFYILKKCDFLKEASKIAYPRLLITVIQLPTFSYETIINTDNIAEKINYYSNAYDDDMRLKANIQVRIVKFILL